LLLYSGANFKLFKYGKVPDGKVAILCVAWNGYHSDATQYQWYWKVDKDKTEMACEKHPVLYTVEVGNYACVVIREEHKAECVFSVTSTFLLMCRLYLLLSMYNLQC